MVTLKEGKIVTSRATLLTNCQGEDEHFFHIVEERLAAFEAPGVSWARETVAPGFLKALKGKRRDFILVRHERFDDILICIGGRTYGTSLDCSWYVIESAKGIIRRLLGYIPFVGMLLRLIGQVKNMEVFDQQDYQSYTTVARLASEQAVKRLIAERKLEIEAEWTGRGELNAA
jgi:hypothetical protein